MTPTILTREQVEHMVAESKTPPYDDVDTEQLALTALAAMDERDAARLLLSESARGLKESLANMADVRAGVADLSAIGRTAVAQLHERDERIAAKDAQIAALREALFPAECFETFARWSEEKGLASDSRGHLLSSILLRQQATRVRDLLASTAEAAKAHDARVRDAALEEALNIAATIRVALSGEQIGERREVIAAIRALKSGRET